MKTEIVEWRGIENLVYAEVLSDTVDGIEFGPVKYFAGTATLTRTTEAGSETHYYDNIPAVVVTSAGADEVSISSSAIPMSVLAEVTGQRYDEELGVMIEGDRKTRYFAIGYIAKKTNQDLIYVWRYKGTFGIPDATHNTENDGTDANGDEITYTGISTTFKFAKYGERAKGIQVDVAEGKTDVSTFFDEVTTPDMLKAVLTI